jgi:murein DD-endopeptidase MepM/ murein hydrolase activator NlpD
LPASAAISAAGRQVTSGFGWRRDPFTGETRFHRGVDLRATYGEDIAATAAGRVAFAGPQGSYGNTVVVEHANGTRTRYAHLSVALVQEGDTVEPGQVVGRAGSSGRATAPHLHLEVTDRLGRPLNPLGAPNSAD